MEVAVHVASAGRTGQDRAAWLSVADGYLIVVADGAGGTSGGAEAAQTVVDHVSAAFEGAMTDWVRVLSDLDARLATQAIGETTAVVAYVTSGVVQGASVGDSGAWVLTPSNVVDLTHGQCRKPLVGSGRAIPRAFGPLPFSSRVLLASDGLLKYAAAERIRELALRYPVTDAVQRLVNSVRLRSGGLQDDVAVALAG